VSNHGFPAKPRKGIWGKTNAPKAMNMN